MNSDAVVEGTFGLIGLVFVGVIIMGSVFGGISTRECRMLGYPTATVNWGGFGQAYCIARQDQSDVILPIEQARKQPRR